MCDLLLIRRFPNIFTTNDLNIYYTTCLYRFSAELQSKNCTIPLYWTFLQEDSINWLISCIKMISLYIQWSMECITFLYSMYGRYWHSLSSLAYYSFRLYLKHNLHVHKNSWSLNFICIIFFFIIFFFVGKVRKREWTRISNRI